MELKVESTYRLRYRIGRSIFTIEDGWVAEINEGDYLVHDSDAHLVYRVPPASILTAEEVD